MMGGRSKARLKRVEVLNQQGCSDIHSQSPSGLIFVLWFLAGHQVGTLFKDGTLSAINQGRITRFTHTLLLAVSKNGRVWWK